MKLLVVFIISFCFSSVEAKYLMIVKESKMSIEQDGKLRPVNQKPIQEKIYFYDGKMAVYKNDKVSKIIDANKGRRYDFIRDDQYIETNLKNRINAFKKKGKIKKEELMTLITGALGANVNYENLKKTKTIKGKKCNLFQKTEQLKDKSEIRKVHCYMEEPPQAFSNYIGKVATGYGAISKSKLPAVDLKNNPHFGLAIFEEEKMIQNIKDDKDIGKNIKGKMLTTSQVENTMKSISTKPFDKKLVRIPKTAKKFVPSR